MPAEDIRHPEKQPKSLKRGRKKYKRQKRKGVLKREKFPNTRKPSHCRICAEVWKHRGQHKREKKKVTKIIKKKNTGTKLITNTKKLKLKISF